LVEADGGDVVVGVADVEFVGVFGDGDVKAGPAPSDRDSPA